jgi:D-sedoheptulose 7-phosphate isomerase
MKNIVEYFASFRDTVSKIDYQQINDLVISILEIKKNKGRIFFLGIGGSAANAGHAVNDFRKICNIECYSPSDNISELTARTNDEGFDKIFSKYLVNSNLSKKDAIFILSVGGGNAKFKISIGIIEAIKLAKKRGAKIFSIVGRLDGYAFKNSDIKILTKVNNQEYLTPINESMQAVIWHCLVSDKRLKINKTKW